MQSSRNLFALLAPLVILLILGYSQMVDATELAKISLGPIKELEVPAGWGVSIEEKSAVVPPNLKYKVYTLIPKDGGAAIEIHQRGRLERDYEIPVYEKLTAELGFAQASRALSGEEIKSLTYFLARIGGNQFLNPTTDPGFRSQCVINSAKVIHISNRNVMRFDGDFHGPDTLYSWVLFYNQSDKRAYEISLRSTSEERHKRYLPAFEQLLKSIKWK